MYDHRGDTNTDFDAFENANVVSDPKNTATRNMLLGLLRAVLVLLPRGRGLREASGQSDAPSDTFIEVSAGGYHTCGITTEEEVLCWGTGDITNTDVDSDGVNVVFDCDGQVFIDDERDCFYRKCSDF